MVSEGVGGVEGVGGIGGIGGMPFSSSRSSVRAAVSRGTRRSRTESSCR